MQGERNKKYFTLSCQAQQKQWKIDLALIKCSQFLRELQIEQDLDNCFTINLPESIQPIDTEIQLINTFYLLHNYSTHSIQVSKIGLRKDQPFLDSISLQFTKIYLNNLTDDHLKKLLQISQYLKLNEFKTVICIYIASKYFFYYNQEKMKKQQEANHIFYSRQMEVNLKIDMAGYAKQFSKDLLENYRKKNMKKQ